MGDALPGSFRKVRHYPRVLDGPSRWDTTARLALPAGYQVSIPEPLELSSGGVRFYMACEEQGDHLTCARRVELTQQILMPEQWPTFRSMVERLRELDRAKIVLFRSSGIEDAGLDGELP